VKSQQDRGTTFHVYLPKSKELPTPMSPDKNKILPGNHEQILVVDDEIPVLDMMQQRLRKMGYRVTTRADSRGSYENISRGSGAF
jgi:hypothetical protein